MRVKMKQQISGLRDGVRWPAPGATLDVPDAEGADLCASGAAEAVAVKPEGRAEKREVVAGKPYLAGERGPEMIVPKRKK